MGETHGRLVPNEEDSETDPPVVVDHAQPREPNPRAEPIEPLGMEPMDEGRAIPADEAELAVDSDVVVTEETPRARQASGDSAVWAQGLSREFEPGVGVFDLDLDIPKGSIFGFIGPSGSGKTTTIRLLTGIIAPDSGKLHVLGKSPLEFDRIARSYLGYMPQLSVLYPELSLTQNLNFAASLFSVRWRGRRKRIREMLDFVGLLDAAESIAAQLLGRNATTAGAGRDSDPRSRAALPR